MASSSREKFHIFASRKTEEVATEDLVVDLEVVRIHHDVEALPLTAQLREASQEVVHVHKHYIRLGLAFLVNVRITPGLFLTLRLLVSKEKMFVTLEVFFCVL